MASLGLKLALTIYGLYDLVLPQIFHSAKRKHLSNPVWLSISLSLGKRFALTKAVATRLRKRVLKPLGLDKKPFLDLPYEVRDQIYRYVCRPNQNGTVPGACNVLILNKQIRREALHHYEQIPHRIIIGDLVVPTKTPDYLGVPHVLRDDWHMNSLKHLVIEVSVCSLGIMTPDTFDVNISNKGKEQWRNLKKLIGIWPEVREQPLESVRLDLTLSKIEGKSRGTYRADFIRILRNFKRTKIWAETGDCGGKGKNKSVLLPLVRAFNQGRRNWIEESDSNNNLIVRYDKQVLSKLAATEENDKDDTEAEQQKWSVIPTEDTSRSDKATWPDWTDKEEKYVNDKMILRTRLSDLQWECRKCLAAFDCPRELREHQARGGIR